MIHSLPSDDLVVSFGELPTGLVGSFTPLGVQIQRAVNGTVVSARTQDGILEVPSGSGNYVVSLVAPPELDDYIIVLDWAAGIIAPITSRVEDLQVTISLPIVPTAMGLVADATKSHLGATYDGLMESNHYGSTFVMLKISVVKSRILKNPPAVIDESSLHALVIDYLGKLAALELIPAAYSYWAEQAQTESTGSDPSESISYPDRIRTLEGIQEELLRQIRHDEALIGPLLIDPRLVEATVSGPSIDEPYDCHVTADPRCYPRYSDFPYHPRYGVRS